MKSLLDIASGAGISIDADVAEFTISGLALDSRKVSSGYLFAAIKGTHQDGHDYIDSAIDHGASVILCEDVPAARVRDIYYWQVEDSRQALAKICRSYYDDPSRKLKLIGVTGTNGKTTIASSLYRVFSSLGHEAALLSTIQNLWKGQGESASLTTPDIVSLHELLSQMVDEGVTHVFMEVSSHALDQGRTAGLHFDLAVFSNLSRDHLDYHGGMKEYIDAKKMLFDDLSKESHALVNADDKRAAYMLQNCQAQTHDYGLQRMAEYKCKVISAGGQGMMLEIDGKEVFVKLIGDFNASNLTAVYAAAMILGEEQDEILRQISLITAPSGRMEIVANQHGIHAIVDYAHTPDALSKVLTTIQKIARPDQKIITVVGCGGDRDRGKRPQMAKIACQWSSKVIFTSDNPRTEDPDEILREMVADLGAQHYEVIAERREAIRRAVILAKADDFILVAGKGHENYQEIKGVRHHFDDREELLTGFEMI